MRRTIVTAALAAAMLGIGCLAAGCSKNESDPELKAILAKMADGSGSDAGLKAQIDSVKDAVRDLKASVGESERKVSGDVGTKLDTLLARLNTLEQKVDAGEAAGRTARESIASIKGEVTGISGTVTNLKTNLEDVASKVKASDPQEYLKLVKEVGEKERAAAIEKMGREAAESREKKLQGDVDTLRAEMQALKDDLSKAAGADVSNHPALLDLKKKLSTVEAELRDAKKENAKLTAYINDMPKNGAAPGTSTPKPVGADPWVAGFRGTVTSATFSPEDQSYTILAEVAEGNPPAIGDVLSVLDDKSQVICEFKVLKTYDAKVFGGIQIGNKQVPTAPTKGDKVVRMKTAEAAGR
jgi:outer membrane murein-binding lipoprotein Lpp